MIFPFTISENALFPNLLDLHVSISSTSWLCPNFMPSGSQPSEPVEWALRPNSFSKLLHCISIHKITPPTPTSLLSTICDPKITHKFKPANVRCVIYKLRPKTARLKLVEPTLVSVSCNVKKTHKKYIHQFQICIGICVHTHYHLMAHREQRIFIQTTNRVLLSDAI